MSAVFLPNGVLSGHGPSPSTFEAADAGRRSTGLAVVVGLHVIVGWALASGLAREAVDIIKKPIEMSIIPEVVAPPPPPPPLPKVEKIRETPKVQAPPPPAYVPPPEVVPVAPAPPPVITAVQAEPPKEPVVIAPPPPPLPAVVKREISLACPGYQSVLQDMLAEAYDRVGVQGTVRTLIKVRGSQVVDALPQSGPKEYYKYVQSAVRRMKCSAGGADEVQVVLDVVFKA